MLGWAGRLLGNSALAALIAALHLFEIVREIFRHPELQGDAGRAQRIPLRDVIWAMPGISDNWRSKARGDIGGHGLGIGAGQRGIDLDGWENRTLGSDATGNRQQPTMPTRRRPSRQQGGGDGTVDEGLARFTLSLAFEALLRVVEQEPLDPDQRTGFQNHLPVSDFTTIAWARPLI